VPDPARLSRRSCLVLVAASAALVASALRAWGQPWWCRCGRFFPWTPEATGRHTSQHLADPYTFTHLLHGLIFYAALRPLAGRLGPRARFGLAVVIEALWEAVENTPWVVDRYRRATLARGYSGDAVLNSLGDLTAAALGFVLAGWLPTRWSVALFLAVELTLLAIYRDNLTLNVLMLVLPIERIRAWQQGA
jgi:hypothetical protein